MNIDFLSMNGYGLFVWLSFGFTIFACTVLYLKTRKSLKKYEKEFATELKKLSSAKQKKLLRTSKVASQVLASYNKSI